VTESIPIGNDRERAVKPGFGDGKRRIDKPDFDEREEPPTRPGAA